jgi:hypothetical protein
MYRIDNHIGIFMKKTFIWFITAILLFIFSCSQKQDIQSFISNLPNVKIETIADNDSVRETYKLIIRQRLDHFGTDTSTFPQKVYLSHIDFSKPVVVVLAGYNIDNNKIYEPSKLLNANQILIEHRYFGESAPQKLNWQYLNIKQSAEDIHLIVNLFKEIYKTKWLSTGISKGGQASLYYKYFYPDDVNATIAYVAPINFDKKEPRVFEFLKNVGTEECRQKVFNFQKLLLRNKDKLLPKFEEYSKNNGLTYKMGYNAAFEYCVLEFSFSFWQWGELECDSIPTSSEDVEMVFSAFKKVGFSFFSEEEIETIRPFFVQAMTEIGFYTYDTKPFGNLIENVRNPNFYFTLPEGVDTTYNYKSMKDVNEFLQTKGDNIIYIYGEEDPWSASAVRLIPGKTNALEIIKKGGNHKTRINDLDRKDQQKILSKLKEWMNCQIDTT